jgi:hypothetical protein
MFIVYGKIEEAIMALKFRRRIRVLPGFTVNLSKSGLSATVGIRGASINLGKRGNYLNVGIPGTGIYDRIKIGGKRVGSIPGQLEDGPAPTMDRTPKITPLGHEEREIKSFNPELLTSEGLFGLKESILHAQREKEELRQESKAARRSKTWALTWVVFSHVLVFGIFINSIREAYKRKVAEAASAEADLNNYKLSIAFDFDKEILNDYITMRKAFERLSASESIWDITTERSTDKVKERTTANKSLDRTRVTFGQGSLSLIDTKEAPFRLENANGGDLLIYPQFALILDKKGKEFGVLDLREMEIHHRFIRFIETEVVPSDSKVVGRSWKYSNKDGSRDKRFKDNYQIPEVEYSELRFRSQTGLNECYECSNAQAGAAFSDVFSAWIDGLNKLKWSMKRSQDDELDLHANAGRSENRPQPVAAENR